MLLTQYGFRANDSTLHALTDVLTSLHDNINNDNCTALLLLDLKKVFDTVYINDISTSVSCTPRLFADDTCLIVEDKNISDHYKKITAKISSLSNWMIANKLTLNSSESNLIVIQLKSPRHRLILNFVSI